MRREPNFIEYPGTGMWLIIWEPGDYQLVISIPNERIKHLLEQANRLFWIDRGMGAATLLKVITGGKSGSATEITLEIYEKMFNAARWNV